MSDILCVCCLCFSKVFSVLKFPRSYFLNFFTMTSFLEVLFIQSSFSDTILWWLPSLTFAGLFCLKVPHQQEFYLIRTKTFDELLTHKWKYLSQKMIQEIRQTSVFDARRTTLFCPVCNRIFQQRNFLKCFFTRFLREQDKIWSTLARLDSLWLLQFACNAIQLLLLTFWEKEWNEEEWEMN